MFTKKDRKIKNCEAMIIRRNVKIEELEKEINNLKTENKRLTENNLKEARNNTKILKENNKKYELINRIETLIISNKYNNEKTAMNKIKELISDYQSQN